MVSKQWFSPARWRLELALSFVATLVLSVCGGGGGGSTTETSATASFPKSGTVFRVVAGLTMVEYDGQGNEIQRSTPTDRNGAFEF